MLSGRPRPNFSVPAPFPYISLVSPSGSRRILPIINIFFAVNTVPAKQSRDKESTNESTSTVKSTKLINRSIHIYILVYQLI